VSVLAPSAEIEQYVEGPVDRANSVLFFHLCEAFEKLDKDRVKLGKSREQKLFHPRLIDRSSKQSMYQLVRLIIPANDTTRTKYGLKESKLKAVLREAIGLRKDSNEGKMLEKFKNDRVNGRNAGDLSLVVQEVLNERGFGVQQAGRKLTVEEINNFLDKLHAVPDMSQRISLFTDLLYKVNCREMKWIIRIIIGDMKIGVKHERFLRALHPDALDQYNTHLNLRRVCAQCKDADVRLRAEVKFGHRFKPMLGFKPIGINKCLDAFESEPFAIEPKLDGERIMIHWNSKDSSKTKLFSRQGLDFAGKYDYLEALKEQLQESILAEECILDGEILVYDRVKKEFLEFGSNRTIAKELGERVRKQEETDDLDHWLTIILFDVVYVESYLVERQGSLTGLPLEERRAILEKIIREMNNKVMLIEHLRIDSEDRDERYEGMYSRLEKVILDRGEGLMLKRLGSTYDLNARKRDGWVKVKPEYCHSLSDAIDVLIVGGYLSEGQRRKGGASHWMIAVAKDPQDGGHPTEFYGLGKVGTGYSLKELEQLRETLKDGEHKWDDANTPKFLMGWKPAKKDDRPDFWYEPHKSVIVSVSGAEIVRSEHWSSQFVVRFPRVKQIRWKGDKAWHECLRFSELKKIFEQSKGALSRTLETKKRHHLEGSRELSTAKRRKSSRLKKAVNTLPASFVEEAQKIREGNEDESDTFAGMKLHAVKFRLSKPREFKHFSGQTKMLSNSADLASILNNNGAKYFTTMPKHPIDRVIVPDSVPESRIANIRAQDEVDIVFISWVERCLRIGKAEEPEPTEYFHYSKHSRIEGSHDKYGDHNWAPTDAKALAGTLRNVERIEGESNLLEDFDIAYKTLMNDEGDGDLLLTPATPFRDCFFYFDRYDRIRTNEEDPEIVRDDCLYSMSQIAYFIARQYGAIILNTFKEGLTHIIFNPQSTKTKKHFDDVWKLIQNKELQARRSPATSKAARYRRPMLVSQQWVFNVVENAKLHPDFPGFEHVEPERFRPSH